MNRFDQLPFEDESEQDLSFFEDSIVPLDPDDTSLPTHISWMERLPPTRRTLLLRISVLMSVVLLFALVLPGSFSVVRTLTTGALHSFIPVPTPTLAPGADTFYFDVNVPWTRVSIDGHQVHVPRISMETPIILKRGPHLIKWTADPFLAQSCVLSVPANSNDTCMLAPNTVQRVQQSPAQLVDLYESLDSLATSDMYGLLSAVQTFFSQQDSQEIVQPGEHYMVNNSLITATQQLRAIRHIQMPSFEEEDLLRMVTRNSCLEFCPPPWQMRVSLLLQPFASEWLGFAFVAPSWDYTQLDGKPVAHVESPILHPEKVYPVLLRLSRQNHQWSVQAFLSPEPAPLYTFESVPLTDNPTCATAQDDLMPSRGKYLRFQFISGPNPASGCLVIATTRPTTMQRSQQAYYLERFGVLLAVNDVAHDLQPPLPVVNGYEQQIVQQLQPLSGQAIDLR